MKELLKSVLEFVTDSKDLNEFIEVCRSMSMSAITISKVSYDVLQKTGLTKKDLAYDCIADLFQPVKGKFICLNKYFKEVISVIDSTHGDIL
ncbi:MAG: hypothetical protein NTV87_12170, partial [Ignavibacteriae bacterium]|nr:hypothetical protein [Ignavibacteriota bacterium]